MSRCNCESGNTCACKVQGSNTDCIDVTVSGTGTLVSPYDISAVPIIDPAVGNQLECGPSGLLVPAAPAPPAAGHVIKDEGVALTQRSGLNFIGNEVVATDDAGGDETDVTINHLNTAVHTVAQPVTIRENSGADVGTRPRLNLIEGTNIALTTADDAGSNEVDITFNAPAFGSPVAVGAANADGAAITTPRSDHIHEHNTEALHTFGAALGTPVAPANIGTVASAGVGNNPSREDHVHTTDAWAAYVPSNTNITVGNGTQTARFVRIGNTVFWMYHLLWGSTTAFPGVPAIGLPVAAAATWPNLMPVGGVILNDADGSDSTGEAHIISAGGAVARVMTDSTGGVVTATAPFTWTTSDVLAVSGSYEVT